MSSPEGPDGGHPPQSHFLESLPQRMGLSQIVQCIGCIASRSGEEPMIINMNIRTCTGLSPEVVRDRLHALKNVGLLETYIPENLDQVERPTFGNANGLLKKTHFFRPTELGKPVFRTEPNDDCRLRNPFVRLKVPEEKTIRCIRCLLSKTVESEDSTAEAISASMILECQNIGPSSIWGVLTRLTNTGLMEREFAAKREEDPSVREFLYTVTDKGAEWLSPEAAQECPTAAEAEDDPLLKLKLTPGQQKILECVACLHGGEKPLSDPEEVRIPTIQSCQNTSRTDIRKMLSGLVKDGYMEGMQEKSHRGVSRYVATAEGEKLFKSVRTTEECPRGRVKRVPQSVKVTTHNPDEIRDRATRAPYLIIMDLPSQTFENGAQFLDHLSTTYYGNGTYLELVIEALCANGRRRLPQDTYMEVQDIVQAVLISISEREDPIAFPKGMPLLYTITQRRIIDHYRKDIKGGKQPSSIDEPDRSMVELQTETTQFEDQTVSRMDAERLLKTITDTITLNDTEVEILKAILQGSQDPKDANLGFAEMARRLNTTAGALRVAKHRLLRRIRDLLGEGGNIYDLGKGQD